MSREPSAGAGRQEIRAFYCAMNPDVTGQWWNLDGNIVVEQ
jgi:hypothetical protein